MLPSRIPPDRERTHVRMSVSVASYLWESKNTGEAGWSSGLPSESDVSVTLEGISWALWQRQQKERIDLGFGSQLWKGAETWSTSIEQQLPAVDTALLQVDLLTKEQHVIVETSILIKGWVSNVFHQPTSAAAQNPTLTPRPYLQQRSTLSTSPLSLGIQYY